MKNNEQLELNFEPNTITWVESTWDENTWYLQDEDGNSYTDQNGNSEYIGTNPPTIITTKIIICQSDNWE